MIVGNKVERAKDMKEDVAAPVLPKGGVFFAGGTKAIDHYEKLLQEEYN